MQYITEHAWNEWYHYYTLLWYMMYSIFSPSVVIVHYVQMIPLLDNIPIIQYGYEWIVLLFIVFVGIDNINIMYYGLFYMYMMERDIY